LTLPRAMVTLKNTGSAVFNLHAAIC